MQTTTHAQAHAQLAAEQLSQVQHQTPLVLTRGAAGARGLQAMQTSTAEQETALLATVQTPEGQTTDGTVGIQSAQTPTMKETVVTAAEP